MSLCVWVGLSSVVALESMVEGTVGVVGFVFWRGYS